MNRIIDEIFGLFARFGSERYGEDVSVENHMLQSAAMAESLGASRNVVVAALLHDIGYFLHADAHASIGENSDTKHESIGAAWLSRAFDADVTAPIAMHVDAKRYLCRVEAGYFAQLSETSRRSLAVQGGIMSYAEAAAFANRPAFEEAVLLRRCDDLGKDAVLLPRPLEHYAELLTQSLR